MSGLTGMATARMARAAVEPPAETRSGRGVGAASAAMTSATAPTVACDVGTASGLVPASKPTPSHASGMMFDAVSEAGASRRGSVVSTQEAEPAPAADSSPASTSESSPVSMGGGRDYRLLSAAVAAWAASLAAHLLFDAVCGAGDYGVSDVPASMAAIIVAVAGVAVCVAICAAGAVIPAAVQRHRGIRIRRIDWAATLTVPVCAALIAGIAAWCGDALVWRDPVSVHARDGPSPAVVDIHVVDPPTVSDRYDAACQSDVRVRAMHADGVTVTSIVTARLYADEAACSALRRDARLRVSGTVQRAEFGGQPIWLTVEDGDVQVTEPPDVAARVITAMQESFFVVCDRLSDQARVLVPGLTLGVLGQEHVPVGTAGAPSTGAAAMTDGADATSGNIGAMSGGGNAVSVNSDDGSGGLPSTAIGGERPAPVNETYAAQLEQRFQRSGIMHLMAVSGGHFVLVAGLIRRLCALVLAHRHVVAAVMAGGYMVLAALMYPSDSVLRALVMGMIGAMAYAVGRRTQAMSALCWTVLAVLLVRPGMSESFGFALSCAAVLGIILFSRPLGAVMESVLPRWLAEPIAMTVAAQALTLPIQILMEPQLPLMSVPANLLVAPVVGWSTLAGLAGLLVSSLSPELGFVFAWLAGCGTLVMERCATWLADGDHAVLPWADGVAGALLIVAVELAVGVIGVVMMRRLRRQDSWIASKPAASGETTEPMSRRMARTGSDHHDGTQSRATTCAGPCMETDAEPAHTVDTKCHSRQHHVGVMRHGHGNQHPPGERWNPIAAWYERVALWWSQTAAVFRSWTGSDPPD